MTKKVMRSKMTGVVFDYSKDKYDRHPQLYDLEIVDAEAPKAKPKAKPTRRKKKVNISELIGEMDELDNKRRNNSDA